MLTGIPFSMHHCRSVRPLDLHWVISFNQCSSFEVILIWFISSNVRFWSNQVQQKRPKMWDWNVSFCNSENQIGNELLQVSEASHKSWSLTIRVVIKRLPWFHIEFEGIHPFIDAHVIIRTKLEKPSKINGLHYFSPYFFTPAG